jgi:hypothetical protein
MGVSMYIPARGLQSAAQPGRNEPYQWATYLLCWGTSQLTYSWWTWANTLLGISTPRKWHHPSPGAATTSAQDCQQRVKGYTNHDKTTNLNLTTNNSNNLWCVQHKELKWRSFLKEYYSVGSNFNIIWTSKQLLISTWKDKHLQCRHLVNCMTVNYYPPIKSICNCLSYVWDNTYRVAHEMIQYLIY